MEYDVQALLAQHKFKELHGTLTNMNVVDTAQILEDIDKNDIVKLFRMLPKERAAEVFAYLSNELQEKIITSITDKEIYTIVEDLFLDDAVDFIEEMPASVVKKVLRNTTSETRHLINTLLKYPEDSAGSIMTIEFVDLKKEMTVADAFTHIRKYGVDKETIYNCYVMDHNRHLEGQVSVKTLLLSDQDKKISEIMDRNLISVNTGEDQEVIANKFRKYDLLAMPVVDNEQRLVGIITIDDAVEVLEDENTEDFQKMAALAPSDKQYLKTSILNHAKNRIVWLLFLMVSATITGTIINKYEDLLQSMVFLAAFIPMLMDTGGNAGSQTATLVIRGMALDEIRPRDLWRILRKEICIGVLVGALLSVVNFMRIWYMDGRVDVALVVGMSVGVTVVMATATGATLPILAKKLKLDPAIMASPFITTLVDAGAVMVYFHFASQIINR